MSAIDWTQFLLFTAAIVGTPGPSNMVLMAAGAAYGAARSVPFLFGVIFGKQLIIWPLGLGIMGGLAGGGPLFEALKWASVAYILYLAWQIAGSRIVERGAGAQAPGFVAGLIVHPLNPKAWALIVGIFTNFVSPDAGALWATLWVALGILAVQLVAQPFWMLAGVQLSRLVGGTAAEIWLMRALALAMVVSVLWAILRGGA